MDMLILSDNITGEYSQVDKNLFSKTDFIEIVFNGGKCLKKQITITMLYLRNHGFSFDFTVRLASDAEQAVKLITPVFDLRYNKMKTVGGNRFKGIAVDPSDVGCIGDIYRIKNPKGVPFVMSLQIPPGWRDLPLYQKFHWEP